MLTLCRSERNRPQCRTLHSCWCGELPIFKHNRSARFHRQSYCRRTGELGPATVAVAFALLRHTSAEGRGHCDQRELGPTRPGFAVEAARVSRKDLSMRALNQCHRKPKGEWRGHRLMRTRGSCPSSTPRRGRPAAITAGPHTAQLPR